MWKIHNNLKATVSIRPGRLSFTPNRPLCFPFFLALNFISFFFLFFTFSHSPISLNFQIKYYTQHNVYYHSITIYAWPESIHSWFTDPCMHIHGLCGCMSWKRFLENVANVNQCSKFLQKVKSFSTSKYNTHFICLNYLWYIPFVCVCILHNRK